MRTPSMSSRMIGLMMSGRQTRSASQTFAGRVLDEDADEVPNAPGIQRTVLLLDNLFDGVPGYLRILFGESVNYLGQRPYLFAYSHPEIFSH